MRILFLAARNRLFEPEDFWTKGLGGNEATLLGWVRLLRQNGHSVSVRFWREESARGFWDEGVDPKNADTVVGFRDANCLAPHVGRVRTVAFVGDRLTPGLTARRRENLRPELVLVASPAAESQVKSIAPWARTTIVPLGHEVELADRRTLSKKKRFQFMHASAPYRGLSSLMRMWPRLKERLPQATLKICGGYQLWNVPPKRAHELTTREVPELQLHHEGVEYLGPVSRTRYLSVLYESQGLLYPTDYYEMYCISVVEAMAAGVVPVTSPVGALRDRFRSGVDGLHIRGSSRRERTLDRFVEATARLFVDQQRVAAMASAAITTAREHRMETTIERLQSVLGGSLE